MRITSFIFLVLTSSVFLLCGAPAQAQDCTFRTSGVAFGEVDTLTNANRNTTGTISGSCGGAAIYVDGTISIGVGTGGASGGMRQMQNGQSRLSYQLYKDSARSEIWGSATGSQISGTPKSFDSGGDYPPSFSTTIYGSVFGSQSSVPPGMYQSQFQGTELLIRYRTCNFFLVCSDFQSTLQLGVSAEVPENCLVNAADINFGTSGPLTEPRLANGSVNVRCTFSTVYTVGLGYGQNDPGTAERAMSSARGDLISYQLFQDPARTVVWGESTDAQGGTGSGQSTTFPVYGRVPAQVTPPAGNYTDVIVVTVTY